MLDNEPGWNEIKMPIDNTYDWNGNGFNYTGWAGSNNNSSIDRDNIRGFALEFSVSGGGEGDYVYGSMFLDDLRLFGIHVPPPPDTEAPLAPENVSGIPGAYFNVVTWTDVDGEEEETYDVYASTEPITDIHAENVEVILTDVLEGSQAAVHLSLIHI